jgi:GntR family transcriptional repressor for pyruvate dehydrogenase complex
VEQLSSAARYFLSFEEGEKSFQDARRLFEAAIAKNAAKIATEENLSELKLALDENYRALGDADQFEITDVNFHYSIARIGNNSVFIALHTAIRDWLSSQRKVALRVPGVEKKAYESHRKIYEAIVARDPEAAWSAMDNHLGDIIKYFAEGRRYDDV